MSMLHCTVYSTSSCSTYCMPMTDSNCVFSTGSTGLLLSLWDDTSLSLSASVHNHDAKKRNHHKKLANKSIIFRKNDGLPAPAFITCWNCNFINVNTCLDKWHATLINLSGNPPEASWLSSLAYGCTGAVRLAAEAGIRLGRMSAILLSDIVNARHFRMRHVP